MAFRRGGVGLGSDRSQPLAQSKGLSADQGERQEQGRPLLEGKGPQPAAEALKFQRGGYFTLVALPSITVFHVVPSVDISNLNV
jgi:hypothetical protein